MINEFEIGVKAIKAGNLVAFPTETVYGLGADATNDEACQKIYKIKGRPSFNPLIVHTDSLEEATQYGEFNDDAYKLSELWPGPLTIVVPLKATSRIAKAVTSGLKTIALRIPSHPVALALIKEAGCPIAAPSANLSGYISATSAVHVRQDFVTPEILILEDIEVNNVCGLESTIVDITGPLPIILRYGFITPNTIETLLSKKVVISSSLTQIKAPGMLDKHYSPNTPLRLNAQNLNQNEIGLNFGKSTLKGNYSLNLSPDGDLIEAATNLYSMLRQLDVYASLNKINKIAIAEIPSINIGLAINDRLKRAAHPTMKDFHYNTKAI